MTNTYRVSCQIDTSNRQAKLGLEIWLDDQLILDIPHVKELLEFDKEFLEDEAPHELKFVMKNKTQFDTRIDLDGNIIKDACLEIKNISFDGIELTYPVLQQIEYVHNRNGTDQDIIDKFYGSMGCNGTATLKFSTPIYLWLLENI